jgi:sugar phosphate isomerase/epimerase
MIHVERSNLATGLKIGISLASLRQPLRTALATAKRLGAGAVEIEATGDLRPSEMSDTALRQLRKLLSDADLKVCAVSLPTRRGYNVVDGLDRRIAATKAAMLMAYQLRAPIVVNRIGRVPEEAGGPGWELFVETLSDLARHGDRVGSTFAARAGSEEGSTLARLLAEVPTGGIGVDFDPAALIINNFSASESLAALGPHVRNFRARDGVRDFSQGRGVETPLGRGTADFPALLGMLEDFAYRGWYTIDREESEDPVTEIGNAVKYLQTVFQ